MKLPEKDALKDIERQNYVLGFTEEDAKHLEDMKVWLEEKGKLKDKYELKDKINLEALKKLSLNLLLINRIGVKYGEYSK